MSKLFTANINRACRTGEVSTPVMLVDRVLLVQVQLEELVVPITFEVFVASYVLV